MDDVVAAPFVVVPVVVALLAVSYRAVAVVAGAFGGETDGYRVFVGRSAILCG